MAPAHRFQISVSFLGKLTRKRLMGVSGTENGPSVPWNTLAMLHRHLCGLFPTPGLPVQWPCTSPTSSICDQAVYFSCSHRCLSQFVASQAVTWRQRPARGDSVGVRSPVSVGADSAAHTRSCRVTHILLLESRRKYRFTARCNVLDDIFIRKLPAPLLCRYRTVPCFRCLQC